MNRPTMREATSVTAEQIPSPDGAGIPGPDHEPPTGHRTSIDGLMITPSASRGSRFGLGALEILRRVWLLLALLAFWEWYQTENPSLFVPPVSDILATTRQEFFSGDVSTLFTSEDFRLHVVASLSRAAKAWMIAVAVGTSLGTLLGSSRVLRELAYPLVRFGMSIPSTALLPVALVLFGISDSMNIFLIAFGATWVILINTIDGVMAIDETAVLTARSFRLSRWTTFRRVLLPGASPQIVTGMRVSLGIALILMVVSELFAASEGLGYYITYNQRTFVFANVWAGVFMVAVIGLAANGLFALFEARVMHWHRAARTRG